MRKFIITIEHHDTRFGAKVMVNKKGNSYLYSVVVSDTVTATQFKDKQFVFIKEAEGFRLYLISKQSCESMKWRMVSEYMDKHQIIDLSSFSMS